MRQTILVTVLLVCAYSLHAQVPKPPFTAQDAEAGKKLAATSVENPRLMIYRDIFRQLSAAREVEFEMKLPTLKRSTPPAPTR